MNRGGNYDTQGSTLRNLSRNPHEDFMDGIERTCDFAQGYHVYCLNAVYLIMSRYERGFF